MPRQHNFYRNVKPEETWFGEKQTNSFTWILVVIFNYSRINKESMKKKNLNKLNWINEMKIWIWDQSSPTWSLLNVLGTIFKSLTFWTNRKLDISTQSIWRRLMQKLKIRNSVGLLNKLLSAILEIMQIRTGTNNLL